jgi:hypothetical protein
MEWVNEIRIFLKVALIMKKRTINEKNFEKSTYCIDFFDFYMFNISKNLALPK